MRTVGVAKCKVIFLLFLISQMVFTLGTSCRADGNIEVRTLVTAENDNIFVFTYGVKSGKICYIVLEIGKKQVVTSIKGELTAIGGGLLIGEQRLELNGLVVPLSNSNRLFVISNQTCITKPLDLSLSDFETKLKNNSAALAKDLCCLCFTLSADAWCPVGSKTSPTVRSKTSSAGNDKP